MDRTKQNRSLRRTILVTGFGAFPGVPRNPTACILKDLVRYRARFARFGVDLRFHLLPVRFAEIESRLAALVEMDRPDAILHLGVASRRRQISVETRAINRAGPLHPDASRARPDQVLAYGAPQYLHASYPAARILSALRMRGHAAARSINAGDYVCNATLYHSLLNGFAAEVGFLHAPKPKPRSRPLANRRSSSRPTDPGLTYAGLTRAVVDVLFVMSRRPL
jgi:pyroglutamyl-peptidase